MSSLVNDNNKPVMLINPLAQAIKAASPREQAPVVTRPDRRHRGHGPFNLTLQVADLQITFPGGFCNVQTVGKEVVESYVLSTPVIEKGVKLVPKTLVVSFLQKLGASLGDGLALRTFVDKLETENLEAKIQVLIDLGFRVPADFETLPKGTNKKKENRGALSADSDLIELLKEKIAICTNESMLFQLAQRYPWYIQASRRAVTLSHVSKKGLQPEVIKFIAHLNKTRPDLAFLLSPTTLHDNTLVDPRVARFFTCDPYGQVLSMDRINEKSGRLSSPFSSVVTEETLKELGGTRAKTHGDKKVATQRIREVTKCIRTAEGFLPWSHPDTKDCGVLLAGGIVCAAELDEEKWQMILADGSDIDLFVYGDTEEDRKAMVGIVLKHFDALGGKIEHFKSVFQIKGLGRDIQVICPFARSPLGVLINFDTTFIQVGYRELPIDGIQSWQPTFVATPGHCFFSHLETDGIQSLITRYNIRMFRLLKLLKRGFIPVSDERGHLLYPTKLFFSSLFPMNIINQSGYTEKWVKEHAVTAYLSEKGYTVDQLKKELGEDYLSRGADAYSKLEIKDQECYDKHMAFWQEKREKHLENSPFTVMVYAKPYGSTESVVSSAQCGNYVKQGYVPTSKPDVDWVAVTSVEEVMAEFHPDGATLSNGFDIYTQNVNKTLPLPADGVTADLYFSSVLLRNVRVVSAKSAINVAAPKEKPLEMKRRELCDNVTSYPPCDYYKQEVQPGEEVVREIEGIFLFGEPRPQEDVDHELVSLKHKEAQRLEKIKEHRIQGAICKLAHKKKVDPSKIKREDAEAKIVAVKPNKYIDPVPAILKKITYRSQIGFGDLHKECEEHAGVVTVPVWEVPLIMTTFAKGAKFYMSASGKKVKRSTGMVKVRAPVYIDDCRVFDVDDLLLPARSLDAYPSRRYNVVVQLMNLNRWVIDVHAHADLTMLVKDEKVVMDLIMENLRDKTKIPANEGKSADGIHVSDFLRCVRYVANSTKLEMEARQKVCPLPHAHAGLVGEMPVLAASRFYVCQHQGE